MNIGWVSQALPYVPSRGGFRLYGANLIRRLAPRHRIHLVSLLVDDDDQHLDWARQHCASVVGIPVEPVGWPRKVANAVSSYAWGRPLNQRRELDARLQAGLREQRWDVLHIEGGFAGGLVDPALPVARILSLHDSWTLRCDEMLRCAQDLRERAYYHLLRHQEPRYERLVYPRFDACVVVTERDAAAVRQTVPGCRVSVVPYAADTEYYRPADAPKPELTIAFHGHLGYAPNIDAVLELADTILPLVRREEPAAIFHLIAADPVPRIRELANRPGITLTVNPPDVRVPLASARIYACPIRHGTGMKTKMLEALAMQLPIVCYPASIAGIDCTEGKHVMVARDPETFAKAVVDLLRDPARARELASAGRALVTARYSWDASARAFERLYEEAVGHRRDPTASRAEPARRAAAV